MFVKSVKLLQMTTRQAVIFCLKTSLKTTNHSSQLSAHESLLVLSGFDLTVNSFTDYTCLFVFSRSPFLVVYSDCGCLTSEKRGDAIAQHTVMPQQTAGSLKVMDAGQTLCWSWEYWCFLACFSSSVPLAQENWRHLTKLLKKGNFKKTKPQAP